MNILDNSYDSYEWTSPLYESIQVVSIGHSCGGMEREREGERQECVGWSVHHHRPYTWPLIIKSIDPLILLD